MATAMRSENGPRLRSPEYQLPQPIPSANLSHSASQRAPNIAVKNGIETTAVQREMLSRGPNIYQETMDLDALRAACASGSASEGLQREASIKPVVPPRMRRKPVKASTNMTPETPASAEPLIDRDLEEEIEVIELLEKKATDALASGIPEVAERVLTKVLRRYQGLAVQYPTKDYTAQLASTHMQIADTLEKQQRYTESLASLCAASDVRPAEAIATRIIEVHIQMRDYAIAMSLATDTLADRRNLYEKDDERCIEILALKIRILLLQDEFDEAEAYYKTMPSTSMFYSDLKHHFHGQETSTVGSRPPGFESVSRNSISDLPEPVQNLRSLNMSQLPEPVGNLRSLSFPVSGEAMALLPPQYSTMTDFQLPEVVHMTGAGEAPSKLTSADFQLPYNREKLEKLSSIATNGTINDLQQILDKYDNTMRWFSPIVSGNDTLFHIAARHGNIRVIKKLLATEYLVYISARNDAAHTPLHAAASHGQEEICRLLLEHGAEVDAQTKWGFTPLHEAATTGVVGVAHVLIAYHADIEARTSWDWTPLHKAVEHNKEAMVKYLLQNGANINALCTNVGFLKTTKKTPYELAVQRTMKNLLKEFGSHGPLMREKKESKFGARFSKS